MFLKSTTPARNEPITRKEVRNVLNPGSVSSLNTPKAQDAAPPAATPQESAAPPLEPLTAKPEEGVQDARLIVGPAVKLKGAEILDCDTLVVEGRVEATMDSRVIRVAAQGSFIGKVSIDIAEIHGNFEGELTARSQLIIHATGRVTGKIRYGKLVIDEGGELCGDIRVLGSEPASSQPKSLVEPPLLSAVSA